MLEINIVERTIDGIKYAQIVNFKMMSIAQLPSEYVSKHPSMWKGVNNTMTNKVFFRGVDGKSYLAFEKKLLIPKDNYLEMLNFIKLCGDRLHKINKKNKKVKTKEKKKETIYTFKY